MNNGIPTLDQLLEDVCATTITPIDQITSSSRKREIAYARHIFCYVAFFYTTQPLKQISELIGGRHHTSAMHSRNTAAELIQANDNGFKSLWEHYVQDSKYFNDLTVVRFRNHYTRTF